MSTHRADRRLARTSPQPAGPAPRGTLGLLHSATPAELQQRLTSERAGLPFLVYRDGAGAQRIVALTESRDRLTIGRRHTNDIALQDDPQVSRVHAVLERVGGDWTLVDDGLSSNGSFLNDMRITARERLRDGDLLRIGATRLQFRIPSSSSSEPTVNPPDATPAPVVSGAKRAVLVVLCRPLAAAPDAAPATNQAIADELCLTVPTVKKHLSELFTVFGVDGAPQYRKRMELAWAAMQLGTVTAADLQRRPRGGAGRA
jgi:pSer/pThr/pTyr-binding forkhead associated (FHA) protein